MKKKIFIKGPVLSQSGYGEQSRFALRALKSREDLFDIYVQPIPWGQTGWIWENNEFRTWLDSRITLTQVLMQQKKLLPDISLQITIPMLVINQLMQIPMLITKEYIVMEYIVLEIVIMEDQLQLLV